MPRLQHFAVKKYISLTESREDFEIKHSVEFLTNIANSFFKEV